jgi:hypothetical protein
MADTANARQGIPSARKENLRRKDELQQQLPVWAFRDEPQEIDGLGPIREAQDVETLREITAQRLKELQGAIKYLLIDRRGD